MAEAEKKPSCLWTCGLVYGLLGLAPGKQGESRLELFKDMWLCCYAVMDRYSAVMGEAGGAAPGKLESGPKIEQTGEAYLIRKL